MIQIHPFFKAKFYVTYNCIRKIHKIFLVSSKQRNVYLSK